MKWVEPIHDLSENHKLGERSWQVPENESAGCKWTRILGDICKYVSWVSSLTQFTPGM